jgi:hypothetical protein
MKTYEANKRQIPIWTTLIDSEVKTLNASATFTGTSHQRCDKVPENQNILRRSPSE